MAGLTTEAYIEDVEDCWLHGSSSSVVWSLGAQVQGHGPWKFMFVHNNRNI